MLCHDSCHPYGCHADATTTSLTGSPYAARCCSAAGTHVADDGVSPHRARADAAAGTTVTLKMSPRGPRRRRRDASCSRRRDDESVVLADGSSTGRATTTETGGGARATSRTRWCRPSGRGQPPALRLGRARTLSDHQVRRRSRAASRMGSVGARCDGQRLHQASHVGAAETQDAAERVFSRTRRGRVPGGSRWPRPREAVRPHRQLDLVMQQLSTVLRARSITLRRKPSSVRWATSLTKNARKILGLNAARMFNFDVDRLLAYRKEQPAH